MDTQPIIEAIQAFKELGIEAKEAFVWYLILDYGTRFLLGLFWTVVPLILVCKLFKLIKFGLEQETEQSEKLRIAAGVSMHWNRSELDKACKILGEHYK